MTASESEKAIQLGGRALAMAEELGLEQMQGSALTAIGSARVQLGDRRGIQDLERSIKILEAARSPLAYRGYGNLGSFMVELGNLRRARELLEEALAVAERFGHASGLRFTRGNRADVLFWLGDWYEALEESERFLAEVEAGSPHYQEASVHCVRAMIRLARGDVAGAVADAEAALARGRDVGEPQLLHPVLGIVARVFLDAGLRPDAEELADELTAVGPTPGGFMTFALVLTALGRPTEVLAAAELAVLETPWIDAGRAYAEGDQVRAADLLDKIGDRTDEAYARLRAAESLVAQGRGREADEQLQKALSFYRSVGATRYVARCEALLAAAS